MKKVYFLLGVLLFIAFQLQANVPASDNVADFNETEIYAAFNEIDDLVEVVSASDVSYASLQVENSALLENVSSSAAIALGMSNGDVPPLMSAFWWGCIFGLIGIVLVAVTTDSDKAQIRSSVRGCVFSSLAYIVVYVIYGIAIMGWFAAAGV